MSAVNDEAVLRQNLLASPSLSNRELPFKAYVNQPSASRAYNLALSEARADTVIFAHQDVYLPHSFISRLRAAIGYLNTRPGPSWAVLGIVGATAEGGRVGRAWSSGLNREVGGVFSEPVPVVSVDELLIVVRRPSGLMFDDALPGFHLYGTDIVQSALDKGFGAYVIHAPVIHNSNPAPLGPDYWSAYRHLARSWRRRLPIPTCIVPVTHGRWQELHYRANQYLHVVLRGAPHGRRHTDPEAIASRLTF